MKTIYLDNNATTPVAPEVFEAVKPFLTENYFNPSSMYEQANATGAVLKTARKTVADFLGGVEPDEVLFTSCATESNNTAIFGSINANPLRRHIITTAVEHPSVLEVCKEAERRKIEITFLSVNKKGELDLDELKAAIRPETLLVSLMHANNETGVIFPIEEASKIVKEKDPHIIFHTDATQSAGKLEIDLTGNFKNVDLLAFSGHKLYAPKGIGALFMRKGVRCRPYINGGHQERGRRAGTENIAFIAGLAKACELATLNHEEETVRLKDLRDKLKASLSEKIPNIEINGDGAEVLPNTLNMAFHCIEGEGILYQLDEYGICASSGSACTSGSLDPSHVLKAMSVPFTAMHGSVRFSLGRYNTEEEIDKVIEIFPQVVANLRRLSPYWDHKNNCPRDDAPGIKGL